MVGEAPDEIDTAIELPFSGAVGDLIDNLIAKYLARWSICLTNAVICPTYTDKTHQYRETPKVAHIEACNDRLADFIELVFSDPPSKKTYMNRPKTILALGDVGLRAVKLAMKEIPDITLFHCIHPGSILRQDEQGALDYSRCSLKFQEVNKFLCQQTKKR